MPVILHICTRYLRGGSEARIRDMMNALPGAKHHLIVGFDSDTELANRQLPADSVSVEPALRRELSPIRDLLCLFRLRSTVNDLRPAVVVTHQSKAGAVGRVAAWSSGVPVVHSLSMASFGPGYPRVHDLMFRIVERVLAPITTGYLVVGEDLAARFAKLGVPRRKLRVVRSGLRLPGNVADPHDLKVSIGEKWGVPAEIPWLVHVGSLEERKNVHLLPPLMGRVQETLGESGAHLFILGEGPLRQQVERMTRHLGLTDSITLTGYVHDALDYIQAAEVVLLLSSAEGMPQVLVQAASVGTPFVAFEVDGLRELFHLGATGRVVEPNDLTTMVDVIRKYLAAGERGRRIDVSAWSAHTIADSYKEFFRDLSQRTL